MALLKRDTWIHKICSRIRKDFSLDSEQAQRFFCSEWEIVESCSEEDSNTSSSSHPTTPKVSTPYLIYRFVFMIILLSSITFSTSCQPYLFHIFLTNWSFMSQNIYAVLFFSSVFYRWHTFRRIEENQRQKNFSNASLLTLNSQHHNNRIILELDLGLDDKDKQKKEIDVVLDIHTEKNKNPSLHFSQQDVEFEKPTKTQVNRSAIEDQLEPQSTTIKLTYLEKFVWILINIVHVLPYCVVLGYWCVVYKYIPDQPSCEKFKSHYIVHGATAILAFLDAMIIAVPARPSHFLIPTALVFFYLLFTCIYEALGGYYRPGQQFIYSVLDWKNGPKKALIFSFMAIITIPFTHTLFCWGTYKLRIWIKSIYLRTRKQPFFNSQ